MYKKVRSENIFVYAQHTQHIQNQKNQPRMTKHMWPTLQPFSHFGCYFFDSSHSRSQNRRLCVTFRDLSEKKQKNKTE